jgi:hypothetical protein
MNKDNDDAEFTRRWAKMNNEERLAWLTNFRDKLRDKYKEKFDITDEQIEQLDKDVAEMEQIVEKERESRILWDKVEAARKKMLEGDAILGKSIPPKPPNSN